MFQAWPINSYQRCKYLYSYFSDLIHFVKWVYQINQNLTTPTKGIEEKTLEGSTLGKHLTTSRTLLMTSSLVIWSSCDDINLTAVSLDPFAAKAWVAGTRMWRSIADLNADAIVVLVVFLFLFRPCCDGKKCWIRLRFWGFFRVFYILISWTGISKPRFRSA